MTTTPPNSTVDIAIVGAGAAGVATAIFAARRRPGLVIAALDGAAKPGAKILVSGGGRCNVTNAVVKPEDFNGGSRNVVRRVLAAFPVARTIEFFREIGVALHEEEHGKLFPDTHQARTVLTALLDECVRRGVRILPAHRVSTVRTRSASERPGTHARSAKPDGGDEPADARTAFDAPPAFLLDTSAGTLAARRVVIATGGRSLPKTGSDGRGYDLARQLGHALVPTTPALVPLVLDGAFHAPLSGIAHDVELTLHTAGARPRRWTGALLWTHFGVSGPVVLDASGSWHRARLAGQAVRVTVNMLPGRDFARAEALFIDFAAAQPRTALHNALATLVPARVADALLTALRIAPQTPLAHVPRDERRRLLHGLLEWELPVRDSRGYGHAEVTAGGIPLDEVDPRTLESRKCPGIHLVGEILDVDGRIGGFNFQWAWASGWTAAAGIAGGE